MADRAAADTADQLIRDLTRAAAVIGAMETGATETGDMATGDMETGVTATGVTDTGEADTGEAGAGGVDAGMVTASEAAGVGRPMAGHGCVIDAIDDLAAGASGGQVLKDHP